MALKCVCSCTTKLTDNLLVCLNWVHTHDWKRLEEARRGGRRMKTYTVVCNRNWETCTASVSKDLLQTHMSRWSCWTCYIIYDCSDPRCIGMTPHILRRSGIVWGNCYNIVNNPLTQQGPGYSWTIIVWQSQ